MKSKKDLPAIDASMTELDKNADGLFEGLTPKEKRVALYLLHGKSRSEIAQALFISENTVKTHVQNILSKTGLKNQKELMAKYLI